MNETTPNQDPGLDNPRKQIDEINEKVRAGQMDTDEADSLIARLEEKISGDEEGVEESESEWTPEALDQRAQILTVAEEAGLVDEKDTLESIATKLGLLGEGELTDEEKEFFQKHKSAVTAIMDIKKYKAGAKYKEDTSEQSDNEFVESEGGSDTETPHIPPEESPETAAEEAEGLSSYLELKRDYKEKKRAFEDALDSRSFARKAFRLGRKNLNEEEQALYDESLVAEKAYYESFLANQKDKIEERLNRNNESEEKLSTIPLLVQRHITKPERERLEAQKAHLPPRLQSLMEKAKGNKYAIAAATTAGIGLKGLSLMSSFGVGLAAGAGTRWGMNKLIAGQEKRLEQKTETFNDLFESGDIDDLGDVKDEYFQELRKIDNRKLAVNLTAAGVAVTAGTSAHDYFDSVIPADAEGILGEKAGEYWDIAKEKAESLKDAFQEGESSYGDVEQSFNETSDAAPAEVSESTTSWYEDVERDLNQGDAQVVEAEEVSSPDAVDDAQPETASPEESTEGDPLKTKIDEIREEIAAERAETNANIAKAEQWAERMEIDIEGPLNFRMEGGVITEIEGQQVPESYFSEADKANVEAARMIREGIATGSLDDALDATEEALGDTIGVPNEIDADVTETPTPEVAAESNELSPEMQEKLDNMRAVQDAQDRAQEMINSEVATDKYAIQRGDTLSEIAEANDVSVKELMEANPEITNPHEIVEGQEINIPEATGSPVYDEGVGLGGPGSEGYVPTESAETIAETAGAAGDTGAAVSPNETPPASGAEVAQTPVSESAEVVEPVVGDSEPVVESESPTTNPEATEQAEPVAEVPDYSGAETAPEGAESTAEGSEEVEPDTETPEEVPQREAISTVPREASAEEVLSQQEKAREFFSDHRHEENPIFTPEWLFDRDQFAGYEPLYTPELLERTIDVNSITASVDAQRQLAMLVSGEMAQAYQAGEIDLPLQWVYLLDIIGDKQVDLGSVIDGSTDWNRSELLQLSQQASVDLKELNNLSSAQIKELGISSGDFEQVRLGDEIKVGELIKIMMQNMAERINN